MNVIFPYAQEKTKQERTISSGDDKNVPPSFLFASEIEEERNDIASVPRLLLRLL
jgi:hypothetical protein